MSCCTHNIESDIVVFTLYTVIHDTTDRGTIVGRYRKMYANNNNSFIQSASMLNVTAAAATADRTLNLLRKNVFLSLIPSVCGTYYKMMIKYCDILFVYVSYEIQLNLPRNVDTMKFMNSLTRSVSHCFAPFRVAGSLVD